MSGLIEHLSFSAFNLYTTCHGPGDFPKKTIFSPSTSLFRKLILDAKAAPAIPTVDVIRYLYKNAFRSQRDYRLSRNTHCAFQIRRVHKKLWIILDNSLVLVIGNSAALF